jgi:ribosomal protein L11 methyltransferase
MATELVSRTGQAIEELGAGEFAAAVPSESAAMTIAADLRRDFVDCTVTVTALPDVDWSVKWRDGIATRHFGRLVVTPSWLPVVPASDRIVLSLDPESAFGSGEHGSTRAALTLLERHLNPGDKVLDFGSGSGILAIAAVLLGASSALGIEVDAESNLIARDNADRNGVVAQTGFLTGDAGELGPLAGPAGLVCSNILRNVNTMLLPAIEASLIARGISIFAGMEDAEEELFRPVLLNNGWTVIDDVHDAGWWGVAARRPS